MMRKSAPLIALFRETPAGTAALRDLSQVWGSDFWNADEVLATLRQAGTRLAYAVANPQTAVWDGMILWREMDQEAELLYVFSRPEVRGRGLGRELMGFFKTHCLPGQNVCRLFLEVRPSNAAAIELYRQCGFQGGGRRRAYYSDGEDALMLTCDWRRSEPP